MKKILLALLAISLFLPSAAQRLYKMEVYRNGNVMYSSYTADVDSINIVEVDAANGFEYVDLGLPSGVKWASCNIGAKSPLEYGDYYAWGELTTKSTYTYANSKTFGLQMNDIAGDPACDVACVKWEEPWRLPTLEDIEELCTNCVWRWTTKGSINGYVVIGSNGNSIFLPAAGIQLPGNSETAPSTLTYLNVNGFYWCSTPEENSIYRSYGINFDPQQQGIGVSGRCDGRTIRPVCD